MKTIKFDSAREVLTSGNVVNCEKIPVPLYAKQMFEDFELETLEHSNVPFKGKKGDYIMIGQSCEMWVVDEDYFNKNYKVSTFFHIRQFADNHEDFHFGLGFWNNSPFNDEAMDRLRNKFQQKRAPNE
jgi:hypothetical protein